MAAGPARLGGYRILSRLGAGAMAVVYHAVQESLGREVALKVMAGHLTGDDRYAERFLREAQAAARVNHPNVVACYDTGQVDGQLFMALELCPEGDLDRLLSSHGGRLAESKALLLALDACRGLEAIEAAGLLHRDLKPANLLLGERGVAKLGDLGLARPASGPLATAPGVILGTPCYMSPEQARGEQRLDIRSDLWSLGATLYHCLAGRPPFEGANGPETVAQLLRDPVPDLRHLAPQVRERTALAVMQCLEKDPGRRWRRAAELREELEDLAGSLAPARRPPSGRQPAVAPHPPSGTHPADTPSGMERILAQPGGEGESAQLAALARRVMVDRDGLTASIVLGPGASFVRPLLERILAQAGVTHGVLEEAAEETARSSPVARRILLARGDLPSPGMPGKSVRGDRIPPLEVPVVVRVSEDAMQAVALTRFGETVPRHELENALRSAGVRTGLDPAALRRLIDGPPSVEGRVLVAAGRPAEEPCPAGFHLVERVANTTVHDVGGFHLRRVAVGQVLARWHEGSPGVPGLDVLGRKQPFHDVPARRPEDFAGEGLELTRDKEGRLVLRALVAGICQQQPDGAIRVVQAVEIDGDLTAAAGPLVTDDLVIIRGSVRPGASVQGGSDVVVLGDVHDARIVAGGSVQIEGMLLRGEAEVVAGGIVTALGTRSRRIMAGSLRVDGEVRGSEIIVTGSVVARRVVGGSVTAAGDITLDYAGDRDGTTTELWAGHHLSLQHQMAVAELSARRLALERDRLLSQCAALEQAHDEAERKQLRIGSGGFVREEVMRQMRDRLARIEREQGQAADAAELARRQLAEHRKVAAAISPLANNSGACLEVRVLAQIGTVLRLADLPAEALGEPRMQVRLGRK